jgi:hypothetical protein
MVLKASSNLVVILDDGTFRLKDVGSVVNKWNTVYLVCLLSLYTEVHGNNVL